MRNLFVCLEKNWKSNPHKDLTRTSKLTSRVSASTLATLAHALTKIINAIKCSLKPIIKYSHLEAVQWRKQKANNYSLLISTNPPKKQHNTPHQMHAFSMLEITGGTSSTRGVRLFCCSPAMAAVLPHTLPPQPDTGQAPSLGCKPHDFSVWGLPLQFRTARLCYENALASPHHPLLAGSPATSTRTGQAEGHHTPASPHVFGHSCSQGQQRCYWVRHIYLVGVCWCSAVQSLTISVPPSTVLTKAERAWRKGSSRCL